MRERRRVGGDPDSFAKLADVFMQHIQLEANVVVASYCAFRAEMNPVVLNEALRARGHQIALPVVTGPRMPLIFRLYEQGDRLLANPMSILEPACDAPEIAPDVLLIPLLAFDDRCNRLGYGGGYYDRTIAALRAKKRVLAIGIAYACQQVAEVPVGPNDIRLDKIVTEFNVF